MKNTAVTDMKRIINQVVTNQEVSRPSDSIVAAVQERGLVASGDAPDHSSHTYRPNRHERRARHSIARKNVKVANKFNKAVEAAKASAVDAMLKRHESFVQMGTLTDSEQAEKDALEATLASIGVTAGQVKK
jgi:hypothetical protein